jgi:hypothetical protein
MQEVCISNLYHNTIVRRDEARAIFAIEIDKFENAAVSPIPMVLAKIRRPRMFLSGGPVNLDSRYKHAGMTDI